MNEEQKTPMRRTLDWILAAAIIAPAILTWSQAINITDAVRWAILTTSILAGLCAAGRANQNYNHVPNATAAFHFGFLAAAVWMESNAAPLPATLIVLAVGACVVLAIVGGSSGRRTLDRHASRQQQKSSHARTPFIDN